MTKKETLKWTLQIIASVIIQYALNLPITLNNEVIGRITYILFCRIKTPKSLEFYKIMLIFVADVRERD